MVQELGEDSCDSVGGAEVGFSEEAPHERRETLDSKTHCDCAEGRVARCADSVLDCRVCEKE